MMLTWRVFSDDNVQGELVTAERMFINSGNGLIFSIRDPNAPELLPQPPTPVDAMKVVPYKKPKRKMLVMITLRAYNAGAWSRVELVP